MRTRHLSVILVALWCGIGATQQGRPYAQDFHSAMQQQDYTAALQIAHTEILRRDTAAEGWFHQGLAQHALHRDSEALVSLDKARSLAPGELRYAQAAAQLAYQAHDASALDEAQAVLRIDPESGPAHGMAGILLLESGRCDDASKHLLRTDVLTAIDDASRLRLAACLIPTRPSEAAQLLEPLRAASHLSASGYSVLGQALSAIDRVPEAVQVLREGCQRFPTAPDVFADLAILSMDHQSPEVAVGVLDAGIRSNPKATELYTLRGSVYAQLAQNEKASADFEKADQLSPDQAYGALGLGMLLRDSSDLEEAQRRLEAKLKQLPEDPLLNYTLADVLVRQGTNPGNAEFVRAETLLRKAIARNGTLPQAYALLGKLLLRSREIPEATRNLEKAISLNSHDRTALNQLVAAYRRAGRMADAARTSAMLTQLADTDRKQETESNRIHLTLGTAAAAPAAP